ncbi:RNA polymerase sigma-70 factor, sigma-E family [Nocardioides terrae]|uniref:RNA polymerase sigma-70 factor, sigma-E family n=1 Tax=Nocardioides terrae TaxID=574651 RepID=A0A1I1DFP0_9ACTN|nr:SigE family RNA polymerase sigma factor [Nocardioides terrae]SFB71878.1 RNA polymerase sigma-70 factor, sigma-E family [Nocardioides terrae]
MGDARPATAGGFDAWASARVPSLLRFAYVVTGSQVEAEDAVQAALERALPRWDRISRAEDPDAYVRRMVVNAHVSLWRRSGRRESPVAVVSLTEGSDPAEQVTTVDAVRRVCAALPRRQRAAVALRFYEDRDYSEIAVVLGCSEATARSYVHRALQALRRELGEEERDA